MNAATSPAHHLYWSVRRELWENRSVYLAPFAVAGLVLVGFSIALARPSTPGQAADQPYVVAAIVLMGVEIVVAILYSLDALYGERRDRSILFWKSLPVSDVTAVLAKASIPVLVLPFVTFIATLATQALMLLASRGVLAATGADAPGAATQLSLLELVRVNFGHLVLIHGLWYAPIYAWLLLASAWATRVPFLWAALPPVAIGVVERLAFNSTRFVDLLRNYFLGVPEMTGGDGAPALTMDMLAPHSLLHGVVDPALWVGLAVSALFLVGAVRLRRSRGAL